MCWQATLDPSHFLFASKSGESVERLRSWGDGVPGPHGRLPSRTVPREVKKLMSGIALQMAIMHPALTALEVFDSYALQSRPQDSRAHTGAGLHGYVISGVLQTLPLFPDMGETWISHLGPCLYSLALDMSWTTSTPTRAAWAALMSAVSAIDTLRNMKALKERLMPDDKISQSGSARSVATHSDAHASSNGDLVTRRLHALDKFMAQASEALGLDPVGGEEHGSLSGSRERRQGSSRDVKAPVPGSPSREIQQPERTFGAMDVGVEESRINEAVLEVWGAEGLWNMLLTMFRKCLEEIKEEDILTPRGSTSVHFLSHRPTSADLGEHSMSHGGPSGAVEDHELISMIRDLQVGFSCCLVGMRFGLTVCGTTTQREAEQLMDAKRRLEEMFSHWTLPKRKLRVLRATRKERSIEIQVQQPATPIHNHSQRCRVFWESGLALARLTSCLFVFARVWMPRPARSKRSSGGSRTGFRRFSTRTSRGCSGTRGCCAGACRREASRALLQNTHPTSATRRWMKRHRGLERVLCRPRRRS